jgi:hypothetical protein
MKVLTTPSHRQSSAIQLPTLAPLRARNSHRREIITPQTEGPAAHNGETVKSFRTSETVTGRASSPGAVNRSGKVPFDTTVDLDQPMYVSAKCSRYRQRGSILILASLVKQQGTAAASLYPEGAEEEV